VTLARAIEIVKADAVVAPPNGQVELSGCFAADLMSDVLAFARSGALLITGLTSDQTVRTAMIKHLPAVLIIEGKDVGVEMVEAAREQEIAVFRTPLSKFETCGLLMQAGLRAARRSGAYPAEGGR